ncbi:phosphate uptake regulator PhoU [Candidatus Thorarchaeota archaeon]|nr:MAG: phosphate uptake regulator PhoU [Candidatus Thorarchaeota archaeon]
MSPTRKLNQVRNSLYVYLPRDWCNEHNLKKHSEVLLERIQDGSLHVVPISVSRKEKGKLKIGVDNEHRKDLANLLVGAYIVGVEELELKFDDIMDMATREDISKWVDKLEGWGILDERSNSVLISDLLSSDREVIRKVLRRQFATTKYMLERTISIFETRDATDYSHIISRDEQVDRNRYLVERLCHLVLRDPSYSRLVSLSPPDALNFSLAAKHVERIADHICEAVLELVKSTSFEGRLRNLATNIVSLYDRTNTVFFGIDKPSKSSEEELTSYASEAFDALEEATGLAKALRRLESSRKEKSSHEILLALHFGRIASYCADIIEIGINRIIMSRL